MKSWLMITPSFHASTYYSPLNYVGMFKLLRDFGFTSSTCCASLRMSFYRTLDSDITGATVITGLLRLVKR
jgi:hypothetical protein